jgi:hypothetical protein
MTFKCPCCNRPVPGLPEIDNLKHVRVSHLQKIILDKLLMTYPHGTTGENLIWCIYQGAQEPETARSVVNVQIHRLRKRLSDYGWTIPNNVTGRGNMKEYCLRPQGDKL